MAKQRLKSPRARLFVALDLPDEVRSGLAAWQAGITDPALRVAPAESLHMTLVFLGFRAVAEFDRISQVMLAVELPAPLIELAPGPVPIPRNRPRLFAIEARSEGAVTIQARLEEGFSATRLHEPEKRPFWPHLTVARVRPEQRGGKLPARVTSPPEPLPEALCAPFRGVRMSLYRSYLRPQGAEYVPISQLDLHD